MRTLRASTETILPGFETAGFDTWPERLLTQTLCATALWAAARHADLALARLRFREAWRQRFARNDEPCADTAAA